MTEDMAFSRAAVVRWVRAVPLVFLAVGFQFGTWLGRLPAVRDELGATATEMSIYGLCLALGSLVGLALSGRIVHRFGPRRVLFVGTIATTLALPGAGAVILNGALIPGLALLVAFGFAFGLCDVAMNVSGANAERAFGKSRMPLMHGGYSLGAVAATGIGAVAEALGVSVPLHFAIVMVLNAIVLFALLPYIPRDEYSMRSAAERDRRSRIPGGFDPEASNSTPEHADAADADADADSAAAIRPAAKPYTPWTNGRILLIGFIMLSFGLFEGTASDWLALALVDGREFSNEFGAAMLSVFFCSVLAGRIAGSTVIERFGRVAVLRASAVLAAAGFAMTILLPGTAGATAGVIAWGLGTSLGWPIGVSAAADSAKTAARDVSAVTALAYGSMLIGPMAFGFLGDHIGLLTSFWALLPFAAYVIFAAVSSRTPAPGRSA